MSNVKNYTEQGGKRTVIGGEIEITENGKLTFGRAKLKPAASQENSEATTIATLKEDFNNLLARLQNGGLMEKVNITITEDSEVDNKINTLTTYTNVSNEDEAWVVDAIIKSEELIPEGTEITINNPAIGGTNYTVEKATRTLWLSDIIKGQNENANTRTKLNQHTYQAFDFTVSELDEDFTTNIKITVVASDGKDLAGTYQSEKKFCDYVVLTSNTLEDVTFKAE